MRILLAPDRFRPSVKAQAVTEAMARGLHEVSPDFECIMRPQSGGGIGTTDIIVRASQGRVRHERSFGLKNKPVSVKWAFLPDKTILLDAADALGEADDRYTAPHLYISSRSLGLVLQRLITYEPRQIVVALGDVMVADGGMGILEAFGVRFMTGSQSLDAHARNLLRLDQINFEEFRPPVVPIVGLMEAPLSFSDGLGDFQLDLIHGGLREATEAYIALLESHIATPVEDVPGSGAGGGLGLALAFLGASFLLGSAYTADRTLLASSMAMADWVFTGTHRVDRGQATAALGTVARVARDRGVPAVALFTELGEGYQDLYEAGLTGLYGLLDRARGQRDSSRAMATLIEQASFRVGMWMEGLSDPDVGG